MQLYRQIFLKAAQEAGEWIRRLCEAGYTVILFGSRARGDARIDSDWDLLVVGKDPPPEPPHDLVQVVFLKPEDIEPQIEKFNTLVIDALYEGKLICGPKDLYHKWRETTLRKTANYAKTPQGWLPRP